MLHALFAIRSGSRWRALRHLSETRIRGTHGRPTCNSVFLSDQFARSEVDPKILKVALEADRSSRAKARRDGHSQPVVGISRSAAGPRIGVLLQRPVRRLKTKTPESKVQWAWSHSKQSPAGGDINIGRRVGSHDGLYRPHSSAGKKKQRT